jgi:hypothetical protein
MRANRTRTTVLLSSAILAGLILTGCGADNSSDAGSTSAGAGMAADSAGESNARAGAPAAAPAEAPAGGAAKDTTAQAPDLSVDQRSIIYRGSVSVRVKDVNAAAGQAGGIATTAGGFVGADNRNSSSGTGTATMELRVPAGKFATVVDQLAKLGTEEQRQITTEDVTEQTVDLDARITVQQARVDSGRKLLAQAKSLNDLVMLEREVATRESDLASLQAKKRRLADLTALSTISVTFLDPQADVVEEDDPAGFLSGLSAGWTALMASLAAVLTVLGALLPWLLILGLPGWAIFVAFRRYNRARRPGAPALATAGAPLAPPAAETRPVAGPDAEADDDPPPARG